VKLHTQMDKVHVNIMSHWFYYIFKLYMNLLRVLWNSSVRGRITRDVLRKSYCMRQNQFVYVIRIIPV